MSNLFLLLLSFLILNPLFASAYDQGTRAGDVQTDTTNFTGPVLTTTETNVQSALEKLNRGNSWVFGAGNIGINTTSNVGIGTTSPIAPLEIKLGDSSAAGNTFSMRIDPVITESGTAAYTALQVNPSLSSVGSGATYLLDLLSGGTSQFRISNAGVITFLNGQALLTPSSSNPKLLFNQNNSAAGNTVQFFTGINMTGASVGQVGMSVQPRWNQTGTSSGTDLLIDRTDTAVGSGTQLFIDMKKDSVSNFSITSLGKPILSATNTAGGTTGAQTINKPSGTVNFAAAATSLVVTNSLVSTSSIVFAVVRTADATATIKNVVPAAGSFTITLGAAATAETSVGFLVIN